MENTEVSFDQLFMNYAKQQEEAAQNINKGGSSFTREYEEIKWSVLETNKPKVLRVQGGPPNSKLDPYTARTVTVAWIVGDDGKKFRLIKPSMSEDPNYIINRIINKVSGVRWINNVKTYPVKDAFPDIYNIIERNGLDDNDPRAKFEKGWKGKEILLMNVIDRTQMDWHKENKHTMLLARNSSTSPDGREFVDEGVSAYAISTKLNHLFASYGSWEKYDIAITRTGAVKDPFIVVNASHSPMEVNASVRNFISESNSLTDEEKSWEKYDLQKIYRTTTSTKIYNRLKNTIKRIDGALGTSFLEDLNREVENEKKMWEEMYGTKAEESTYPVEPIPEPKAETPKVEETQVRSRSAAPKVEASIGDAEAWKDLPFSDALNDEQKKDVKEVIKDASGKIINIKWNCPPETLALCPDCGVPAPAEVTQCPVCGMQFV